MQRWLVLGLLVALAACGAQDPGDGNAPTAPADTGADDGTPPDDETPPDDDGTPPDDETPPDEPELPTLAHCVTVELPGELPTEDWQNLTTSLVTLGGPHHDAQDGLATAGHDVTLSARFTYGLTRADLGEERIEVLYDDCSGGYVHLADGTTDSDGWLSLTVPASALPDLGEYALLFRVRGDDSRAPAALWVLPEGTQLMIFDIDGTLTTDDAALFQDIVDDVFSGDYVPAARDGAVLATKLRQSQGYVPVYLTGRTYTLAERSRSWLRDLDFAPGPVHFAPSTGEAAPLESGVGDYKATYLNSLIVSGFVIDAAYGNATTDIYAYAAASVPPERSFILGSHGGEDGTVGLGETYLSHLDTASQESPADQPFAY